MKKISLLIFLVAVLAGTMFSQTITVDTPVTSWRVGGTYDITWTKSGTMDANVKIRLMKGHGGLEDLVLSITDSTANNQSYEWEIPDSVAPGSYLIRVKTVDNAVGNDSGFFKITPKTRIQKSNDKIIDLKRIIKIIEPSASSNWQEGKTYKIIWERKSTVGRDIKIRLFNYNGTKAVKAIKNIPWKPLWGMNSKTLSSKWTVPKGIYKWPGNHRIKIFTTDGKAKGTSEMFRLSPDTEVRTVTFKATIWNKWKRSRRGVEGLQVENFTPSSGWDKPAPSPGPGKMRVGYQNKEHDDSAVSYLFRSFAKFNVKSLKDKGYVLEASVSYKVYSGSPKCITKTSHVDADSKSNSWGVPLTTITNQKAELTHFVRTWINYPETNHGLLFSGAEHMFKKWGNNSCVAYAEDVVLKVKMVIKK